MLQNTQVMAGIYAAIVFQAWRKGAPTEVLWMMTGIVGLYILGEKALAIAKLKWPPPAEKPLVTDA